MRGTRAWIVAAALSAAIGCSGGGNTPTDSGNGNGGGAGGGPVGTVTVGNIFFESGHNGTRNPAQDTVAVGQTVTWTWTNTGSEPHSVRSEGSPSFTSSAVMTGNGSTYSFTFTTPGTYQYDCAVHGAAMSGTIVVQ
jgi:plastocyanin